MNRDELIKAASGGDLCEQKLACYELARLDFDTTENAEFLLELAGKADNHITRASALSALEQMGEAALETLTRRLAFDVEAGGTTLLHLLRRLGPAAAAAGAELQSLLSGDRWHLLLELIGSIGPDVGYLAEDVAKHFGEPEVPAVDIAVTLGKLGAEGKRFLVKELQQGEKEFRLAAIEGLSYLGRQTLPEFRSLLSETDADVQRAVAKALCRMQTGARGVYVKLLESDPGYAGGQVLQDLGTFGYPDREMERKLIAVYKVEPSVAVIRALGRWGTAEASGKVLTGIVEDWLASDKTYVGMPEEAVRALALLSARAGKAGEDLAAVFRRIVERYLSSPKGSCGEWLAGIALAALGFYPSQAALTAPLIESVLKRDEEATLLAAARATERLGAKGATLVAPFLDAMFSSTYRLEALVSNILLSIGPGAFPVLTQLLDRAEPNREQSLAALIGSMARSIREGVLPQENPGILLHKVMLGDDYDRQDAEVRWTMQRERLGLLPDESCRIQLEDWKEQFIEATLPLASVRIRDSESLSSYYWAETLVQYGKETVPILIGCYQRSEMLKRRSMASNFAELAELYAPEFVQMLEAGPKKMRMDVIDALRGFGRAALPALPRLRRLLERCHGQEERQIRMTIERIEESFLGFSASR